MTNNQTAKVHFLAPVSAKLPPKEEPKVDRPSHEVIHHGTKFMTELPEAEYAEIAEIVEKEGFGFGAIVVRRGENHKECKNPFNWGFVMFLNKHKPSEGEEYRPLGVKWFNNQNGGRTFYEMEELYVIHTPYSSEEFDLILSAQDNEIAGG